MEKVQFEALVARAVGTEKIKLLVKGDNGIMITLHMHGYDRKVATCSMFVGTTFQWEINGSCLILKSAMDSIGIELLVERYDLEELV